MAAAAARSADATSELQPIFMAIAFLCVVGSATTLQQTFFYLSATCRLLARCVRALVGASRSSEDGPQVGWYGMVMIGTPVVHFWYVSE